MYESFGSVEHQVRQLLGTLQLDTLMDCIICEAERRCMEKMPLYCHILRKLNSLQHYEVINAIWQEAHCEFEKLGAYYKDGLLGRVHATLLGRDFGSW